MKRKTWGFFFAVGALAALMAGGHLIHDHEKAIKKVPTSQKVVALTFDDGPHQKTTPTLLAVLAAKDVRATFFIVGENGARYPQLLTAIVAGGHEVANHTYDHRIATRISRDDFFADLARTEAVITSAAPKSTFFRPPGGGYNDRLVWELRQHGYTTILWSVDPRDWEDSSVSRTAGYVLKHSFPGAIILLHEGNGAIHTPEAVAKIIDGLREQGYSFLTVGELLQYYEIRQ
jgi:peptidoglycan/xylan/chitin deacetylase (PgdA/CDA1 family)